MEKNQSKVSNAVDDYVEQLESKKDYIFVAEDIMSNRLEIAKVILTEETATEVRLITMLATIADNISGNIEDYEVAFTLLNNALAAYIEARSNHLMKSKNTRLMDEACLEAAIMKVNGTPLN